jgi:hypothetical protein
MVSIRVWVCVAVLLLYTAVSTLAQQSTTATANAIVPTLANFSGILTDSHGKPLTGIVGVSFYFYNDQQGGAPLWMETQNIQPDKTGHYSVVLGSTSSQGLPTYLFVSGEARWLGVQAQGQVEQPRIMLLSVPYALKAGDAETLGGKPASAYALAGAPAVLTQATSGQVASGAAGASSASEVEPMMPSCNSVTSDGTAKANALAKFTGACNVEGSGISESSSGNVGIGGTAPSGNKLYITNSATNFGTAWVQQNFFNTTATKNGTNYGLAMDMNLTNMTIPAGVTDNGYRLALLGRGYAGTAGFAGTLAQQYGVFGYAGILQATSGAKVVNATAGQFQIFNEQPGTTIANAYGVYISNASIKGTITNRYDLYASSANAKNYFAGNVGIATTNPTATLEVNGTAKFDGLVSFGSGQSFPGTATLGSNRFTGSQTVNGNLSATGVVTGSSYQIGSNLFAFGSYANANTFLGFAGNTTMTGAGNTASGENALSSDTIGMRNSAAGAFALSQNAVGSGNTASGYEALGSNVGDDAGDGSYNVAMGSGALYNNNGAGGEGFNGSFNTAIGANAASSNTAGGYNTASGYEALQQNTTGSNNTASGVYALWSNSTGISNTADGMYALRSNSTGSYNTAVGYLADVPLGSNLSNATAIGAYAQVTQSNALVLGCASGINFCPAAVSVGIATTAPTNVFTIGQGAGHAIADGWDTYSSRRWKTNVQTLRGALGKVEQLRGVSYDLETNGKHEVGVIAEEVGAVVPEVVTWEKNGKDARSVDYTRLTALLIEATKEQQREIQAQQAVLETQAAAIRDLKSELRATRQSLQKVKAQRAAAQPTLVAAK